MNPDLRLSSYVLNMISVVSRLIYNYNSKPTLSLVDYCPYPLCFQWGNNCLSRLQECLSWKRNFFIHFLDKQCHQIFIESDVAIDLQLSQELVAQTKSDIFFLKANGPCLLRGF